MNGFERRTQQKRDAILAAAQELFMEHGISAVSVSEIAQRAGVSPVTIFKYFGDKLTLAREMLLAYINDTMASYDELLDRDIPFMEKMRLTMGLKEQGISLFGGSSRGGVAWEDPILQRLLKEVSLVRGVPLYLKLIECGKREGVIDPTIPNAAILDYFLMFVTLIDHPDFMQHDADYLMGLVKLSFYGLIGKATL